MIGTTERRGSALTPPGMVNHQERMIDMSDCIATPPTIPYGYCQCGCGQKTTIIKNTDAKRGRFKGEPNKFCYSHHVCKEPYTSTDAYIDGDTVVIPLQTGLRPRPVAFVDVCDFERVMQYRWVHSRRKNGSARVNTQIDGHWLSLHRYLTNAEPGMVVDHADGDPMNNRRSNLRVCTHRDNSMNTVKLWRGIPQSKYKGVTRFATRWQAILTYKGESFVERFDTELEAAHAYDEMVRKVSPEFGRVNFPQEGERPAVRNERR